MLILLKGVIAQVRSSCIEDSYQWKSKYFVPVATFFTFNLCDYLGRTMTNYITLPGTSTGKGLAVLSFLRWGFWGVFALCNIGGKSSAIPTLIDNDIVYIALVVIFG